MRYSFPTFSSLGRLVWLLMGVLFLSGAPVAFSQSEELDPQPYGLEVKTNQFGNLHIAGDVIEVSCFLHGLISRLEGLDFSLVISDRDGRTVRRFKSTADIFRKGTAEQSVAQFRMRDLGVYSIDAEATYRGKQLDVRRTHFSVVASPRFRSPVEQIPFGLVFVPDRNLSVPKAARQMERLNVEWVKVRIAWQDLEQQVMDETINRIASRDVRVVGQLVGIDRSAASVQDDTLCGEIGPRFACKPPADWNLWEKFVFDTVNRYKDRVHCWEIWMDPQGGTGPDWQGSAEDFATLVEYAVRGARRADPGAILINPGILGQPQEFANVVAARTEKYTEIQGFRTDSLRTPLVETMPKEVLEKIAKGVAWVEESRGGNTAAWIQEFVLSRVLGIGRVFRYAYRDSISGRETAGFVSDEFVPTEHAAAFSFVSHILEGTKFQSKLALTEGFSGYLFNTQMDSFYVIWRQDDSLLGGRKWPLDLHFGVWWPEEYGMFGRLSILMPNMFGNERFWIGEEPIILRVSSTSRISLASSRVGAPRTPKRLEWSTVEAESRATANPQWKRISNVDLPSGGALAVDALADQAVTLEIPFEVAKTASYEIHFAGSPLSQIPWALSSFAWQIDGEEARTIERPGIEERSYAKGQFAMTELGKLPLGVGSHVFRLKFLKPPANGSPSHQLSIDSLMLKLER